VLVFGASLAVAEPTTGAIQLDQVRPYIGGNTVFVYPHGQGPCSGSGALNIYTIDLSTSSGKAAYAAALAAITAGKMVMLEVIAGQCGSSYPALQSIYSLPN
jgi:hypothetical protein